MTKTNRPSFRTYRTPRSCCSANETGVIGDAKKYVREHDIDWDELNIERKKQLLHEASAQSLETGPIRRLWPSRYRYPRDVKS